MQKTEIVNTILTHPNKLTVTENFEYVKAIFREAFHDQEAAKKSKIMRQGREYRWFEVYHIDENQLTFVKKEDIELYIDKEAFAAGHFHDVKQCK